MMVDYNIKEYGEYEALARATQGGRTNSYAKDVLQILPKEDVSAIIRESTGLDGRIYFEKLGTLLAEHKSELHSLCKKFNCLNPPYMVDQLKGLMIRKTNVSVGAPSKSANNCPMALHLSLKDRIQTCKLCCKTKCGFRYTSKKRTDQFTCQQC